MKYYALRADMALAALDVVRTAGAPGSVEATVVRGSGADFEASWVKNLAASIYAVKEKYASVLRARDPAGGAFEAEACSVVHQHVPQEPTMLADSEFWLWLAVTQFAGLVDWRHGGEEGRSSPANFGVGSLVENLLYRLWLRADVGFDPNAAEKYDLSRRGDQDFWRSHIFRQGYARCRKLAKGLVKYQFPSSTASKPTLSTTEIRELAKRLKRLDPNLMFDYLDEGEILALIKREAVHATETVASAG